MTRGALGRAWRGVSSVAAGLLFPLGGWWLGRGRHLAGTDRLTRGLAVVLPGVEGRGLLNWSVARGLADGGFPGAVVVHDWTTGFWPLFAFHLRAHGRGRRRAAAVARLVADYRDKYPGRPVHLVGHSGGGAVAVWALEALPPGCAVDSAVLLGAALSPRYPLAAALKNAGKVWHFWSPFDVVFLGVGTFLVGTSDGRHSVSAGLCGFRMPVPETALYRDRLVQRCYRAGMLGRFHWGGHLGWANRVFVAEAVAPLLSAAREVQGSPAEVRGGRAMDEPGHGTGMTYADLTPDEEAAVRRLDPVLWAEFSRHGLTVRACRGRDGAGGRELEFLLDPFDADRGAWRAVPAADLIGVPNGRAAAVVTRLAEGVG